MKRLLIVLLALALWALPQTGFAAQKSSMFGPGSSTAPTESESAEEAEPEETPEPAADNAASGGSFHTAGNVSGEPDEPALSHPEERYTDYYVEETDGSEQLLFGLVDTQNDESADIEKHGAVYITENSALDANGRPAMTVKLFIQNSPYGKMLIMSYKLLWMEQSAYTVGEHTFSYDGNAVEESQIYDEEEFDFYCESYHFPYGRLETLNGIRTDENGYMYMLVKSDDTMSFEFVLGDEMRVVQLRVYEKDADGVLNLFSYSDYDVGPALEIPQPVLDAMAEVLEPVDQ